MKSLSFANDKLGNKISERKTTRATTPRPRRTNLKPESILSDVRILRFVAQLRRKFLISRMDVGNVAWENRIVSPPINREWKTEYLEKPRVKTHVAAAETAHDAVAGGGGISFAGVDLRDRRGQFGDSENQVRKTAAEFARRAVIIRRRILDIGEGGEGEAENQRSSEQGFHRLIPAKRFRRWNATSVLVFHPDLPARREHRHGDRDAENHDNDDERDPVWNRKLFSQDHFCPDETEDEGEPGRQVNEAIDHAREQKVERAQSQNGADV